MNNQSEDRILGYVGTYPVGDYNAQTEYEYLNVVTHKGSSYVCIKEEGCIAVEPPNEECWQLFAGKGDTGEKGDKGDTGPIGPKPVNGVDYNTNAEREEFKNAVVADSKADLEKYITEKETQLDNYTKEKETKLDDYVTDTVKPTIDTYVTDTTKKDIDAYEKEKEKVLDTYTDTKKTEIDNYVTNTSKPALDKYEKDKEAELETAKNTAISEYDAHAETLTNRIADLEEENSELVQQMPWNTTEIQESIHIEDSAKYSRNKLDLFGNLKQETREGYNIVSSYESLTDTTQYKNILYKNEKMKENTEYTISFKGKPGDKFRTSTGTYGVATGSSTITVDSNGIGIGHFTTIESFTTNSTGILSNLVDNNTLPLTNICIAEGYYEELPFEQYGAMPSIEYPSMPVVATGVQKISKIGKNYWKAKYNFQENGLTVTTSDDGLITVNGTTTKDITKHFNFKKNIKKGKYILSVDRNMSNYKIAINLRKENKLGVMPSSLLTLDSTASIVNITELVWSQSITFYAGYTYNNVQFRIQLEEGNTKTNYEPYKEEVFELDLADTELCKITDTNGNVVAQDRPVYREVNETMKWQFEKQIKKLVITGTTFKFNLDKKDDSGKLRFLYSGFNCYSSDFWVCDKLKVLTYRQFLNPEEESSEYICGAGNYPRIYIKIDSNRLNGYTEELTDAEVVTLFKEFLNKNNITVYYIQGTSQKIIPEYEDCTVEQSEVLDKLYKLQLEKGVNNIFVESENGVTTELQLEYMQDNNLKKEQENKALEDRITAIEELLSTTETSALLLDNMQEDLEKEVE